MSKLTLVPAYGRDYKSPQEVQSAWDSNQDFVVRDASSPWDGSYFNADDAKSTRVASVRIQFRGGREIFNLRLAEDVGGWDTGFVDTENRVWQPGQVVQREDDGGDDVEIGNGSQVPPPRDDFGTEISREGDAVSNVERVAGWEGLSRRVQKAHRKNSGVDEDPLSSDEAYDIMDDIQNKADQGIKAVNILRYYLDKGPNYVYGALGAWDFLITRGPIDWRKDLAKLQTKIKISAQELLDDSDWMSQLHRYLPVEAVLKSYAQGKPTGRLKFDLKRWTIVGVETKHDAGKAWIQINKSEIHSGKGDDETVIVTIDPVNGDLITHI